MDEFFDSEEHQTRLLCVGEKTVFLYICIYIKKFMFAGFIIIIIFNTNNY